MSSDRPGLKGRTRNRNRSGQEAEPRDRVGGGMQRSGALRAKPDRTVRELEDEDYWSPGNDCANDFHFVKFEHGTILFGCKCLQRWYND